MTTPPPNLAPPRAADVLTYETSGWFGSRGARIAMAAWAVLALVGVLAAFPLGVAVSILMESKSRGLFTSHQGERGGFAVFACGEVLASAAGWFALRHARRANGAKWTKAVAASAGVLGAIGAIIALLILLRDGVP
jgi:hypothetical protein